MFGSNFPSVILFERNLTALRLRRIPFTIEAPIDPFYSESNMERLHDSFRQAEEGKLVVKTMEELEELAEDE